MALSAPVSVIWTALWVSLAVVSGEAADVRLPGRVTGTRGTALNQLSRLPLARTSDLLPLFPPLGTPPPPAATEEFVEFRPLPSDLGKKRGDAFHFDVTGATDLGRQLNNEIAVGLSPDKSPSVNAVRSGTSLAFGAQDELFFDSVPSFSPTSDEGKVNGDRPFRPSIRLDGSLDELFVTEDGDVLRLISESSGRRGRRRHQFGFKSSPFVLSRPPKKRPASFRAPKRRASRLVNFRPSPRTDESTFRPTGPLGLSPARTAPLPLNR